MKSLKNIFFISIALIFTVMASCKKYPDGPLLSLRTKEHRVVGEWNVNYFSINGYDSTTYLQNQPLYGTYIFGKSKEGYPGNFVYNSNGDKGIDTNRYYSAEGSWEFKNNKKYIHIISRSAHIGKHFTIGAFVADDVTWEIRRLKENELWLKTTYTDGREYFVKFTLKPE